MTDNPSLLFIYGTLLLKNNEFGAYLQNKCKVLSKGRIKGTLYDAGEYPGAIVDDSGGYVYGSIYTLADGDEVLKTLDEYEGISINDPQPHEYLRLLIPVETEADTITCWVYVYNWPVDALTIIEGGDYLAYKGRE